MIAIPRRLEERLRTLARQCGRRVDDVAHEAILQYVEDAEDVREAERILRQVRAGREKTYTLEHVAKRIGLIR
jgi:RHH-type rel operon transcriptional repressor/antitoxin RelB